MDQNEHPKVERGEPEPVTLLVVDDEEDARILLERVFDQEYRVFSAGGAEAAKQILQEHKIDVVVSDQRMPGVSGVELLAWAFERYPDTVRILTTAHDDLAAAILAINQGRIHRYITKPWDIDELRNVVRAEATTRLLQRANLILQQQVAHANVELREANEALHAANQRLETEIALTDYWRRYADAILLTLPVSLIALDEALIIRSLNKPPPQTTPVRRELVGAALHEAGFPAETVQALVEGARQVFVEAAPHSLGVMRIPLPAGERMWSVELFPIRDPDGELLALLVIQDVTESHYLRVALIQSEKMASIGNLAAGVAHEFNNLIGGILGYAQLAELTHNLDDYKKTVQVVFEVAQRAKKIIGNLLTFSRRSDGRKEVIKVADLVDQVVTLVERRFAKQKINIAREIPEDLAVELEVGQLQQALLQLLMAAQQAMPDGGQIAIRARLMENVIYVEVEDTGEALSPEDLKFVFEPFFGLRSRDALFSGRAKGAGLAVVRSIVHRMGAQVEAKPGLHGGGLFTIVLPPAATISNL